MDTVGPSSITVLKQIKHMEPVQKKQNLSMMFLCAVFTWH